MTLNELYLNLPFLELSFNESSMSDFSFIFLRDRKPSWKIKNHIFRHIRKIFKKEIEGLAFGKLKKQSFVVRF